MNQPFYNPDAIPALLRSHDIALTHQRLQIAQVLFACMQHVSADQILVQVNKDHSETSKATVYNTLKLFLEKGLVREVIIDPARVFYDPNIEPHHHLYNIETGELTDIAADTIAVTGLPSLPDGLTQDSVDIIVRVRPSH
jgi:Fur family transcriptional regulator, iron response regulator